MTRHKGRFNADYAAHTGCAVAVAGHAADTTEFAFAPIVACSSLSLCGLHASMEAFDSAGGVMRRRPLTLVIDEIVELLSSSLAMAILDAGYFLRLDVAAALLTDCSWVNELVRLQREEGCDLAVQISVNAGSLDPFDARVRWAIEALRLANVGVVVRLSKTSLPPDIDSLIRAGVGEIAAAVEILCNLAVGPSAARALRELGSRPALVSMTAQNLASAKGLDIARALGCACACGPFLGDRINALEAKQLIRRSLDRPAFAAR